MIELILEDDNLSVLKKMKTSSVDSFILDPPFNSKTIFTGTPDDDGVVQVLKDNWAGGIESYKYHISLRVKEMVRCLKPNGNIIIHCDQAAKFSLHRVCIENGLYYRDEIIWSYSGGGVSTKTLPKKHDTIFVFSKTSNAKDRVYNPVYRRYSAGTEKIPKSSSYTGNKLLDLEKGTPITSVWDAEKENMAREEAKRSGKSWAFNPEFGTISSVNNNFGKAKRAVTEKPLALYERLVYIYTNEGDLVVDPYMGGGTTILAAALLGRDGIGIDNNIVAYKRATDRFSTRCIEFKTNKDKSFVNTNPDSLDPHTWGTHMIGLDGGTANPKLSGDGGVDGWNDETFCIYQAKKYHKKLGPESLRATHSVALREMKKKGWPKCTIKMITHTGFTGGTIAESRGIMNDNDNIKVELLTGEDILANEDKRTPISLKLTRQNNMLCVDVDSTFKKPIEYVWLLESKVLQQMLFGMKPKPFKKKTQRPELELTDIKDIKKFDSVQCSVVFDDGSILKAYDTI